MIGYKELNIYKEAYRLAIMVHKASLKLPNFELFGQGSQIRRSSKSIRDAISEGYGRRRCKADNVKFLVYAQSSCDECVGQIDMIQELYPDLKEFEDLQECYVQLGKMINRFVQAIEKR